MSAARTYSVVHGGVGFGWSVVTVKPGQATMRPLPVVVVSGPWTTREQAEADAARRLEADDLYRRAGEAAAAGRHTIANDLAAQAARLLGQPVHHHPNPKGA